MQTYNGSCHCGAVTFEIEADVSRLVRCNCSICAKKGSIVVGVPIDHFRLLSGKDALTLYQFNKKIAEHYFCKHCGIHAFGHPRSAPDTYSVNVRTLDGFDLGSAEFDIDPFDGQNWEDEMARRGGKI